MFSGRKQRKGNGKICTIKGWLASKGGGEGVEIWLLLFWGPIVYVSLGKAHYDLGNVLWLFESAIFSTYFSLSLIRQSLK